MFDRYRNRAGHSSNSIGVINMGIDKNKNVEVRMKRILLCGIVIGFVCGGICFSVFGGAGEKEKEDETSDKIQNTVHQQVPEQIENEEPQVQVVDAVEAAKLNAESLASEQEDWKLTLVNKAYPLSKEYAPKLVEIEQGMYVDQRIVDDLKEMLADIRADGLNPYICSAYRDYEYQRQVFNETMVTWIAQGYTPLDAYDETAKSVAVPGTSEHATGLALDITSAEFAELDERQAETAEAKWFAEHCWEYGFILRYPVDKSAVTGIVYEPWHYRYVGKEAAREITEQGLTLEEYLGK